MPKEVRFSGAKKDQALLASGGGGAAPAPEDLVSYDEMVSIMQTFAGGSTARGTGANARLEIMKALQEKAFENGKKLWGKGKGKGKGKG